MCDSIQENQGLSLSVFVWFQVGVHPVDPVLCKVWGGDPDQKRLLYPAAVHRPGGHCVRARRGVPGVQATYPQSLQPGGLPPGLASRGVAAGKNEGMWNHSGMAMIIGKFCSLFSRTFVTSLLDSFSVAVLSHLRRRDAVTQGPLQAAALQRRLQKSHR